MMTQGIHSHNYCCENPHKFNSRNRSNWNRCSPETWLPCISRRSSCICTGTSIFCNQRALGSQYCSHICSDIWYEKCHPTNTWPCNAWLAHIRGSWTSCDWRCTDHNYLYPKSRLVMARPTPRVSAEALACRKQPRFWRVSSSLPWVPSAIVA